MNRSLQLILLAGLFLLAGSAFVFAFPKPSPYPIAWELKLDHSAPKRLVMKPRGADAPEAFWYMTFTVTNTSDAEQKYFPRFEMMTNDGDVFRSDNNIPPDVIQTIRARERNPHLQSIQELAGTLRIGEDQAKEGVAIWREPNARMGRFSIFASGLSGEGTILKDDKGNPVSIKNKEGKETPVVLWKTLKMDYHMLGDELQPGVGDTVESVEQSWVMR